jgi:hypothetical protein
MIRNLVETWRQRGSNNPKPIVDSNPDDCCTGDCNQGRDCPRRKIVAMKDIKTIKWLCAVGIAFAVGLSIGEFLIKKTIIDDCQILGMSRFDKSYIQCRFTEKP